MGARELLATVSAAGLSITADGDRLVIRPASKLTDPLRDALRQAKPELLVLLHAVPSRMGRGGADDLRADSQEKNASDGTGANDDLATVARTPDDLARFTARRDRLVRWGWAEADAERMAERLALRDREQDDRVSCTDCRHYRPGRCGNHRRAGLGTSDVGRDLATLLQRCPGFKP